MATTQPSTKNQRNRSSNVRHSKEDALSNREFEQLLEGAYRLDGGWSLQCRFVVLMAGRLGMRAGEIAHMTEEWVDYRRNMICIPRYEPCTDGRYGGICASCRQHAEQKVDHNEEMDLETALAMSWSPKTDSAAREIPFDADERAALTLERYFETYDEYSHSQQTVSRRVDRAAEAADGIEPELVYPHALRATAASRFAGAGIDVFSLKAVMGWSQLSTARNYVTTSGERTAQALRDANL